METLTDIAYRMVLCEEANLSTAEMPYPMPDTTDMTRLAEWLNENAAPGKCDGIDPALLHMKGTDALPAPWTDDGLPSNFWQLNEAPLFVFEVGPEGQTPLDLERGHGVTPLMIRRELQVLPEARFRFGHATLALESAEDKVLDAQKSQLLTFLTLPPDISDAGLGLVCRVLNDQGLPVAAECFTGDPSQLFARDPAEYLVPIPSSISGRTNPREAANRSQREL